MERILCLVIGYVLGNIQTAFIYGKMHGIDIRDHGSGNAGTTNALRVLGSKAGLIVFVGDLLKCGIAVLITRLLFGASQSDMIYLYMMYAAMGTILGHNFPAVLGFRGGKGIACTAGLIIFYHPLLMPVGLVMFVVPFVLTKYVSLGSLLVYAGFMIEIVILGQCGILTGLTTASLYEVYAIAAFLTAMAYIRHKENIKRLLSGTERKTELSQKHKS
ncbi:MAG: glycerol-3-phosphate 1-O-acyltransferase PlsY [Lachnospiraceae bacterium]